MSYYLSREGQVLRLHSLLLEDSMDPTAFDISEWIQVVKKRRRRDNAISSRSNEEQ